MSSIWQKLTEVHTSNGIKNGYPYSMFLLWWKFVDGVVRDKLVTSEILSENMSIDMFTDIPLSSRPAFSNGRFRKNDTNSKSVYRSMMKFWFKVLFDSENPYIIRKTADNDLALHLKVGKSFGACIDMLIGFVDEVPKDIFEDLQREAFHALIACGSNNFVVFGPISYLQHCCKPDLAFTNLVAIGNLAFKPPSTEYRLSDRSGFKKVIKVKVLVSEDIEDIARATKKKMAAVYLTERLITACYQTKKENLWFDCTCKVCVKSSVTITSKKRKRKTD